MTSERDFYAAMDENPDDIDIRGIFADWLDERNDPLAAGWRALWVGGYTARWYSGSGCWGCWGVWTSAYDMPKVWNVPASKTIPADWFSAVAVSNRVLLNVHKHILHTPLGDYGCGPRALLDALAVAFAKLPAERQAELLRPATTPASAPAPA